MKETHVIIIGAGFGGITAAIKLADYAATHPNLHVTLIDKNSYQLYTPALYEIAAIPRENADAGLLRSIITIPIASIIASRPVRFIQGEFTYLNPQEKTITLADGNQLFFSFLILALGSETNYFGIPGLEKNARPLKNFKDGVLLRNAIETMIRQQSGKLAIVIGGGGSTGVELAAEFDGFICMLQKMHRNEHTCNVEITIIEAAETILSGFSPQLIQRAQIQLKKLNIVIQTNTKILSVREGALETSRGTIPYNILIWAGGIQGPRIYEIIDLPKNKKGQLIVNDYLEAYPGIFAIGDNAAFSTPSGKGLPGNVPVAEEQARAVAKNIRYLMEGKLPLPYRAQENYPYILSVGKKFAIADLVYIHVSGFFGWFLKQIVELRYLLFILPFFEAIRSWIRTILMYTKND